MTRTLLLLSALLLAGPAPTTAAPPPSAGEARKANRLLNEASPYLQQHAYNPVDWYPWGREAFDKAAKENKPILLSVGYSTCHWCHVMERESFSDATIARLLNDKFVAIKVDRERRPDVDETYMLATELIHRRGGWPNNVFLTPERKPFFALTYAPAAQFGQILASVDRFWTTERKGLESDADRVAALISQILTRRVAAAEVIPAALKDAADTIMEQLDVFHGGFSTAPKFPQESILLLLAHLAEQDANTDARHALTLSLDNILDGGIHDHVGGGFHRYATDPQWRVPHFEKMLYNQALVTMALVRAHRLTGSPRYAAAARRAFDYVLADLTDAQGGFYSARDADSEGEEGTFYVWTPDDLKRALGPEDGAFAAKLFGVTEDGNFEGGRTVLHLPEPPKQLAATLKLDEAALMARADALRRRLAAARAAREAPHRDEKIIAAWNGMMIASFAEAAQVLGEPRYLQAAEKAGAFVWERMRDRTGLKRSFYQGQASLEAQQEDHAYMALGFLALYDATHEAQWLQRAETLAGEMVTRFRDEKAGDYFMTASTAAFNRAKSRTDGSMPSGNAVALDVFAKLMRRSRNPEHRLRGEALLAALSGLALQGPSSSAYGLLAADRLLRGETGPRRFFAKGVVHATGRYEPARGVVTVRLQMAEGWHINADKPLEEFFIPTELKIQGQTSVEVRYPAPVRRKLGFHDKELALYEGTAELTAKLAAPPNGRLGAELRVQACSDEICLEPETAVLTLPIAAE